MSSAANDSELRLDQRLELKPRVVSRSDVLGDREIQRFVADERQQCISHPLTYSDVGAWPFCPEAGHGIWHEGKSHRRPAAERDRALGSPVQGCDVVMYFAQLFVDHAPAGNESTACGCKHDALGCAYEQLSLHFALELRDALTYRRLGNADFSCRRAQAPRLDDGQQVSDLIEPHS
jgi:hypothetical protein